MFIFQYAEKVIGFYKANKCVNEWYACRICKVAHKAATKTDLNRKHRKPS